MLAETIRRVVGSAVSIVDSAATTAASVGKMLTDTGLSRSSGGGSVRFLATDSIERFVKVGGGFLDRRIAPEEVALVDL